MSHDPLEEKKVSEEMVRLDHLERIRDGGIATIEKQADRSTSEMPHSDFRATAKKADSFPISRLSLGRIAFAVVRTGWDAVDSRRPPPWRCTERCRARFFLRSPSAWQREP